MANINLLHELLMFAKTSGRRMTVEEAVEEYYSHYLEDCCHTPAVRLISQEYKLREILSSSVLKENQKALVYGLLEEIGIAKAEETAILKDCIAHIHYDDEEYYDLPF